MKRKIALNPVFGFGLLSGVACLVIGIFVLIAGESTGLGALILALLFLLVVWLTPVCYVFDSDGVACVYLFFTNERYLWKRISKISLETSSGRYQMKYYQIRGVPEGQPKRHMNGEIHKTFRTKRLLNLYWDDAIENEKKRKSKRRKIANHVQTACDDKEVKALEREVRARVRSALQPILEKAVENGFHPYVEYYYVIPNGDRLRSRPEQGYVYEALITITEEDEKDSPKKVQVGKELIHVRKGRSGYVGVESEKGIEDLMWLLSDTLDTILQNGMDAYRNDWKA